MNITVLVKPVPYKSIVDGEGNVIRNKIKNIINKDDKHAIEEALRIKEKTNGKVCSISMSVKSNIKVLREILSLGVDDAILLNDNIFAGSDTNSTAYILQQAIRKLNKTDLIICGKSSSDSATSQVGIGVAAKLDIPFIYNVCEILNVAKDSIKCKVVNDENYEVIESKLPCLVIVNDSINVPRIPTVTNRLLAEKKEITIWNCEDINCDKNKCGYSGSVTNVIGVSPLNTSKNPNYLKGTNEDQINELIKLTKENKQKDNEYIGKFDIKQKNCDIEYWIYGSSFNLTCELIAKCHKLASKTNAKIVTISFNNNDCYKYIKYGSDKVININTQDKNYMTKILSLEKILRKRKPEIFLFSKTYDGKVLSAYLAAKLNFGLSADCTNLELDENNKLIQIRSAYGGTMLAKIIDKGEVTQMATVLPGLESLIYNESHIGEIENIKIDDINTDIKILESQKIEDRYLNKDIIISCGMGAIKQIDNLKELAKLLDASLGITRDVLDKGYLNSNYLIGQSGAMTKTKLFLSFGVSGAIEHTVGINSKLLVSINNDLKAPILSISDYYIIEDVNVFIPLLISKLKEEKNEQ